MFCALHMLRQSTRIRPKSSTLLLLRSLKSLRLPKPISAFLSLFTPSLSHFRLSEPISGLTGHCLNPSPFPASGFLPPFPVYFHAFGILGHFRQIVLFPASSTNVFGSLASFPASGFLRYFRLCFLRYFRHLEPIFIAFFNLSLSSYSWMPFPAFQRHFTKAMSLLAFQRPFKYDHSLLCCISGALKKDNEGNRR